MSEKFFVIGGGAWGTAICAHVARIYESVVIYSRCIETVKSINSQRRNIKYLPSVILPDNILATNNLEHIADSDVIFIAVPSSSFCNILDEIKKYFIKSTAIFVIATKGIVEHPVEMLSERFVKYFNHSFCFLYGPNFAKEVGVGKFTMGTIASIDLDVAKCLSLKLSNEMFEFSATDDIITVQVASIIKNIVAIRSGILDASGEGENAKAALITKAMQELSYISLKIGGKVETLFEAAVLGDLVLTSYSKISRNTKFGFELHQNNYSKEFIKSYSNLVEGIQSAKLIKSFLANHNINLDELPIINFIVNVLSYD